ncbi:MAG: cell division protein FtsA [Elusimicrobiota bacterium]
MAKHEIMCGLDMGSSQVTCVAGRRDSEDGQIEIVSGARAYCRGVSGGVVVNIGEAAQGIKKVIEEIEEKTGEIIHDVYVGLRGSYIETSNNRGMISISRTDKEITDEDVTNVIENSKAIQISHDRDIIDVIPQEFSVDRQKGVPNPIGMQGNYLEAFVHIVTASLTYINNIHKAVTQAGFNAEEFVYSILGVGDVVVLEEEKELGCLLIDFGGQTTSVAVYSDKSIRFSRELQLGSDLITRDISHALRTSIAQAKEIKERYGVVAPSLVKEDREIEFIGVDGRSHRQTTKKYLADIIGPRFEEVFEELGNVIRAENYADVIMPGGAIITGGGALIEGCEEACSQVLGINARLGLPQGIKGPNDIVSNPAYAAGIGILKYKSASAMPRSSIRFMPGSSFIRKIQKFFR